MVVYTVVIIITISKKSEVPDTHCRNTAMVGVFIDRKDTAITLA